MAKIIIKGRREPLEIENARAQIIKNRKLGLNGETPADPLDLVDLGEWCGEYGRIVEIEFTKEVKENGVDSAQAQREREEKEQRERWLKLSPEAKGEATGRFKLSYAMRLGQFKLDPPEDVMKKVVAILTKYYKENPTAMTYPTELTDHLLPPKAGQSLAEKMDVNAPTQPNGLKCKKCDTDLKGNVKEYCSGQCMLDDKNGQLSTE